jgi:hypothetical protein
MGRLQLRVCSFLVIFLLLTSTMIGTFSPTTTQLDEDSKKEVQSLQWNQTIEPPSGGGFQADFWRPDTTGALWGIDFSPDGSMIAGVDINEKRVLVWNITDGRVVFYSPHPDPLVDVMWLDSEHLLIADSDDDLVVFEIIDTGSNWPINSTTGYQMTWAKGFTGTENGFLWGMDISEDRSRVVICGGIDNPNIPGEIVTVETSYLMGGSGNPNSIYTSSMPTDCSLSPNGSVVASTLRYFSQNQNQDRVVGYSVPEMELLWDRAIAGSGNEVTAWAIDWDSTGESYTVGWNRPNEGVVTNFHHIDGQIEWYSPIPQNISSIAWSNSGNELLVGLHDPGRMMFIDQMGSILNDVGWHSFVNGGEGVPADVLDVSSSSSGLSASSGRDGTIEIWGEDASGLTFHSRVGTRLTREIAISSNRDLVAMANSGGVVTVWDLDLGLRNRQCHHPNFGEPIDTIPFAKSVEWLEEEVIIGFSDGKIVACDEQNKNVWTIDLAATNTVSVFGRARVNMHNQIIATFGENPNNTSADGVIAVISQAGQILREWRYPEVHWTIAFDSTGERMSSISQEGGVRLWTTSGPDPLTWTDEGIVYSHENYSGVNKWFEGILITAGWDSMVKMYDPVQDQVFRNIPVDGEVFSIAIDINGEGVIVGSGDVSTSTTGKIEFIDPFNETIVTSLTISGIPRGMGISQNGALIIVNHTGTITRFISDLDLDGVPDEIDAFPNDQTQWTDSDNDGFGDNSDGNEGDYCPLAPGESNIDRFGCLDSDGDGVSDPDLEWLAHPLGVADAFVDDPFQSRDSDGDGVGDSHTFIIGSNGLRIDSGDAFPADYRQSTDRDGDGCGDNYTYETDNDGYRTPAFGDAFPNDNTQCIDLDGDGNGDNYSFTIDPNTGLRIESGDLFPFDFLAHGDPDNDGCVPESSSGLPFDYDSSDPLICQPPEEEIGNNNSNNSNDAENEVVCPQVICWDGSNPNSLDCSCPPEVIVDGPSENSPNGEDVSDSSNQNSTLLILLIIGTIALLGSIGYLMMNRLNDDSTENMTTEENCPHCNGPIQEAVANGGKWTWCHSCRKWLEYKGPVD